jgi:hypothetical protein
LQQRHQRRRLIDCSRQPATAQRSRPQKIR